MCAYSSKLLCLWTSSLADITAIFFPLQTGGMEQTRYKPELPPAFPTVFPGPVQLLSPWVGVGGGSLLFLVEYKVAVSNKTENFTTSNQFLQFTVQKYTLNLFIFKNYRKTDFQIVQLTAPTWDLAHWWGKAAVGLQIPLTFRERQQVQKAGSLWITVHISTALTSLGFVKKHLCEHLLVTVSILTNHKAWQMQN